MKTFSTQTKSNEQGNTVLMVLAVLGAAAVAIAALSIVLINQIRLNRSAASGTNAYYAAVSGAERGLFMVKDLRDRKLVDLGVAQERLENSLGVGDLAKDAQAELRSARYWIASGEEELKELSGVLAEGEVLEINLFDPDNPSVYNPGLDAQALFIEWQGLGDGVTPSLDVTNNAWTPADFTDWDQVVFGSGGSFTQQYTRLFADSNSDGWADFFQSGFSRWINAQVGLANQFRIKAVGGDIRFRNLKVVEQGLAIIVNDEEPLLLSDPDNLVPFSSYLQIIGYGESGNSARAVAVQVPWRVGVSGYVDFTIFTELDIEE